MDFRLFPSVLLVVDYGKPPFFIPRLVYENRTPRENHSGAVLGEEGGCAEVIFEREASILWESPPLISDILLRGAYLFLDTIAVVI